MTMRIRIAEFTWPLVLLFSVISAAPEDGYQFPLRWQGNVIGVVQDGYVLHKKAVTTGYIYTDYVLNISRADEVWNVTSIEGTPLSKQFYSDTHYFSNDGQWFWYFNSDGATCDLTKGIKGPIYTQDLFNSPAAYNGTTTYSSHILGDVPSYLYMIQESVEQKLWVSQATFEPVAFTVGPAKIFWDGTLVEFLSFREQNGVCC